MKHDYSHITLVCDRSGSMAAIRDAAQSGVREFVDDQKRAPGTATLHLYDFCAPVFATEQPTSGLSPYTPKGFKTIYQGDVQGAPAYNLSPSGMTALLDALGKTITDTGAFLANLPEHERPEHVFFVVQTDGEENSSQRYRWDEIRDMIKHQEEVYNWTFVYLGMGADTFAQGQNLGFANAVNSAASGNAYAATYAVTSHNVAAVRGGTKVVTWNVDVDSEGNVKTR